MNMAYLHRLTAFWTTLYQGYPSFFHSGALFLLIFAAFGQSLNFDFVCDDLGLIVDNDNLKAASPWYSIFLRDFWEIGQNIKDSTRNFYRPIISFSYLILLVWSFRRQGRKLFFPLAFVPLTLLSVFNLGTFGDVLFANRFLYIPSFGLSSLIMALFLFLEQWPASIKSFGENNFFPF